MMANTTTHAAKVGNMMYRGTTCSLESET